jgi:hypothetical protein
LEKLRQRELKILCVSRAGAPSDVAPKPLDRPEPCGRGVGDRELVIGPAPISGPARTDSAYGNPGYAARARPSKAISNKLA